MMDEQRLAEIEQVGCDHRQLCDCERKELVAEVRRLRRSLQLSEASRGVPSDPSAGHRMSGYQTWGSPGPAIGRD